MRLRDSTLTRVKPLFDFIGKDIEKLNQFFRLFGKNIPGIQQGSVKEIRYGKEKLLPPSKSLLIWMLHNLKELRDVEKYVANKKDSKTFLKREELFAGDNIVLKEALNFISTKNPLPKSAWYIFEGYTHPDIYIETDDSIFICEAKRTEKDITKKTIWLNPRDQFIPM